MRKGEGDGLWIPERLYRIMKYEGKGGGGESPKGMRCSEEIPKVTVQAGSGG